MTAPARKANWKRLADYRCPLEGCGALLKEFRPEQGFHRHECTACDFRISNEKLESFVVRKDRKMEPPEFIKEIRRQEELNNWRPKSG